MKTYSCSICKKPFKTTQHLNQHNNKKKTCILQERETQQDISPLTTESSVKIDDSEFTEINFEKTIQDIQTLVNEKKEINELKSTILKLQNENLELKSKLFSVYNVINGKNQEED